MSFLLGILPSFRLLEALKEEEGFPIGDTGGNSVVAGAGGSTKVALSLEHISFPPISMIFFHLEIDLQHLNECENYNLKSVAIPHFE